MEVVIIVGIVALLAVGLVLGQLIRMRDWLNTAPRPAADDRSADDLTADTEEPDEPSASR